jgi:hypothetical protein
MIFNGPLQSYVTHIKCCTVYILFVYRIVQPLPSNLISTWSFLCIRSRSSSRCNRKRVMQLLHHTNTGWFLFCLWKAEGSPLITILVHLELPLLLMETEKSDTVWPIKKQGKEEKQILIGQRVLECEIKVQHAATLSSLQLKSELVTIPSGSLQRPIKKINIIFIYFESPASHLLTWA